MRAGSYQFAIGTDRSSWSDAWANSSLKIDVIWPEPGTKPYSILTETIVRDARVYCAPERRTLPRLLFYPAANKRILPPLHFSLTFLRNTHTAAPYFPLFL